MTKTKIKCAAKNTEYHYTQIELNSELIKNGDNNNKGTDISAKLDKKSKGSRVGKPHIGPFYIPKQLKTTKLKITCVRAVLCCID